MDAAESAIGQCPRLMGDYAAIRARTEALAAALSAEDQCVQSMPDASPTKWHRAHVTWFFEEFLLVPNLPGYRAFNPDFRFLFNSYYDAVGARHPRPERGLLTRPPAEAIADYRAHVDAAMTRLLAGPMAPDVKALVVLGLNHEQQHQELLLTDILHAFSRNSLAPAAIPDWTEPDPDSERPRFIACGGGVWRIGAAGAGFRFDNEAPVHDALLTDFLIGTHLVRNRDFLAFMDDGGYRSPGAWMSDGWAAACAQGWTAPLYWRQRDGIWFEMGLAGERPLNLDAAVRHISWYEADAYARWANARLPTEAEWEIASQRLEMRELAGHVWQWTDSAYRPYPGYRPASGAVGEYNGKFMINQMVLRGGSQVTPRGHTRPTYRNFFHPDKRWQFCGLRLARDC